MEATQIIFSSTFIRKQSIAFLHSVKPTLQLKPILRNEDKSAPAYTSAACQQLLQMYDDYYPKNGYKEPWIGYFIVKQDTIVGSCGFVGQPKDGCVEIAYWTFAEYEGQGIASFACKELIRIVHNTNPKLKIMAKTAPEHNASTKDIVQ
jgi:ribosomal-protein-alanine N-acetyltransferase